jgi:hypothetical protein
VRPSETARLADNRKQVASDRHPAQLQVGRNAVVNYAGRCNRGIMRLTWKRGDSDMYRKTILVSALVVLGLAGCTTIDPARLADISIRQPTGPLELRPAYDAFMIREDLVRATHSETRTSYTNGRMSTYSVQVPNAYHLLGIELGNGILMDYNNNLFVDLIRFYGMDDASKIHITRTPKGFSLEGSATYVYENGTYRSNDMIIWTERRLGNQVELDWSGIKGKDRIEVSENSVVLTSKILGVDVVKSATLVSATELAVRGFWRDASFTLISPDRIQMERFFEMDRYPDHISIIYKGIFGITTERTFVKTAEGFLFFTPDGFGVEVMKKDNVISVYRNGKPRMEYEISEE